MTLEVGSKEVVVTLYKIYILVWSEIALSKFWKGETVGWYYLTTIFSFLTDVLQKSKTYEDFYMGLTLPDFAKLYMDMGAKVKDRDVKYHDA